MILSVIPGLRLAAHPGMTTETTENVAAAWRNTDNVENLTSPAKAIGPRSEIL
jgi:hypothetical protein